VLHFLYHLGGDAGFLHAGGGSDADRAMAHGIGAAMNIAVGAGFTTAHTNRHNSIAITLNAAKLGPLATADACRVNGYNPVTEDALTIFGAC
jgi:hypothetical protein